MGRGLDRATGRTDRPGKRLSADQQLRNELDLCATWGIPHSQFLGGDGRWTELDRAKALEWQQWQRTLCSDCRTRASDWDPAQGGHRHAYIADTIRCPGCEVIAQEQSRVPDGSAGYGVKITLLPRDAYLTLHQDDG